MTAKGYLFIAMMLLFIIAAVAITLISMGKLKKSVKPPIADDLKKKKYDTEEYKGEINTKSLTELFGGDDWKEVKTQSDLKTGVVSEDLITAGNKRLEKALLNSEALNKEKETSSESLGMGIFTKEERTGLLESIIEGEEIEADYRTSILIPDEEMDEALDAPKDLQEAFEEKEEDAGLTEDVFNVIEEVGPEKEETDEPYDEEDGFTLCELPGEDEEIKDEVPDDMDKERQEIFDKKKFSTEYKGVDYDEELVQGVFLIDASVVKSTFRDTKLENVIFSKVLFKSVSFKYAELSKVNIIGCTFKNCDFSKTDFGDAILDDVKFINCTFDKRTELEGIYARDIGYISGDDKEQLKTADEFREFVASVISKEK